MSTAVVEPWPADRLQDGHVRGRAQLENGYVAGGWLSVLSAPIGAFGLAGSGSLAWAFVAQGLVAVALLVLARRAE